MPDREEKLPAELRARLLEAEKFREHTYPDWKRGMRYGGMGLLSAVLVFPVAYLAAMEGGAGLVLYSSGIVIAIMVIAFVFGAFRPPR